MKLVVDTNIVFSTLLNPHSSIGEILMNVQDEFTFFAPQLLKEELEKYTSKIMAYSKLTQKNIIDIEKAVLSIITFVREEAISEQSCLRAFDLTKDIDEDDTPFVALGVELNAKLWTGDKTLSNGLFKKGVDIVISTAELKSIIK